MRHRKQRQSKLDRKTGPRKALVRSLAESLIIYESIVTTPAKAVAARRIVERIITLAKKPTLAQQRNIAKKLSTKNAVAKVINVLGPRFIARPGGYTRITKLGTRRGDGAATVRISLLEK